MGKIAFIIAVIVGICCFPARADYHYASHEGTNEYPYSSWEMATDSIQLAIDAAEPGDTVYVGAGIWRQQLVLDVDRIALIGQGIGNTIIENYVAPYTIVVYSDTALIEGFSLLADHYDSVGVIAISVHLMNYVIVKNNYFYGNDIAINGSLSGVVRNNIVEFNKIALSALEIRNELEFAHNTIYHNYDMSSLMVSDVYVDTSSLYIHNNLFYEGIAETDIFHFSLLFDSLTVYTYNNVFSKKISILGLGNAAFGFACSSNPVCYFYSNTINGVTENVSGGVTVVGIHSASGDTSVALRNNIIINCEKGVDQSSDNARIYYSDFFNVDDFGDVDFVEGNIFTNPMFDDTLDYHLQAFSPCIDAGDPNILDPDGSRSDMGAYGGPSGEYYEYQDLPPRVPDSLQAEVSATNDTIYLNWIYNTEADFSHYYLYRDTLSGFEPSVFTLIAQPETSLYVDTDFAVNHSYYYRIAAIDNQDNLSDYSNQLGVIFTGFAESDPNLPRSAVLYQNYPNPFNQNTLIRFYLPNIGYQPAAVQLVIYDILGRRVRLLVDERFYPGEHEVVWGGHDDTGQDLSSGVYFYRLLISNAELTGPKKLMLIK